MNNKELKAETEAQQSKNAELLTSSPLVANPMLAAVLFVGARIYKQNYNDITQIITIDRVTKTQAFSNCGNYKFNIGLSSYGTAKKIGNTERWTNASYYLETKKLKETLFKQETVRKLSKTDFSKFGVEILKSIVSLVNGS